MLRPRQEILERVQAFLGDLDYDLRRFTLDGLVRCLEKRRGRTMIFFPFHFVRQGVSGAWMEDDLYDYIFYETKNTPPVLQAHTQFHEMAHIICGHSTARVTLEDLALLCSGRLPPSLTLRIAGNSAETEQEAETLASVMREQILRYARLDELLKAVPSNVHLLSYFDGLKVS